MIGKLTRIRWITCAAAAPLLAVAAIAVAGQGAEAPEPGDRGPGVPSSQFGLYIPRGQLLVFPFAEYTLDRNREYQPEEFGFGPNEDFRGKFHSTSGQLFLAYGVSDFLAVELEGAYLHAKLETSPQDTYGTPPTIDETGLTDLEGQVRLRLRRESPGFPEIFGYVEVTAPSQKDKLLIGDERWEAKPGLGIVKTFSFGTMTMRTNYEYNHDDRHSDIGETSIEYLRRFAPDWHFFAAFEGGETGAFDEWEVTAGLRWRLTRNVSLKLDNTVGVLSKSNDWVPQLGVLFTLPVGAVW